MTIWKRNVLITASAFVFALSVLPVALAGPLEDGKAAYESGDSRTAMSLLLPLAEQGNADAQFEVATIYDDDANLGKVIGSGHFGTVDQDVAQYVRWFRKAAEQGNARAQYDVGALYEYGTGVPKDYVEAAMWYRKGADNGDAWAQDSLGRMYEGGLGLKRDTAEAVRWYCKALEQGYRSTSQSLIKKLGKKCD